MARRTGILQPHGRGDKPNVWPAPDLQVAFLQGVRSFRNAIQGDHQGKDDIADDRAIRLHASANCFGR